MLLSITLAAGRKELNDICKEKDKPDFKLNLTSAMIFPDYIFMMDNNSLVYKVPKANYDGSYGKMTLNMIGVPIEEYWPAFKGNEKWECVKKQYKSIYHLINNHTGVTVINFFLNKGKCIDKNGHGYSLCYNLTNHQFCPLIALKYDFTMQFYVDTGLKVYSTKALKVTEEKTSKLFPALSTWHFFYLPNDTINGTDHTPSYFMFYLVDKSNSSNRNVSIYLVYNFTIPIDPPPAGYRRENITDWNLSEDYLPVGYLYNGSFYLYALDKLIVFEDRMPTYYDMLYNPDKYILGSLLASTKVTIIKLSDYFQCESANLPNVTHPPDGRKTVSTSTDSSTMLILIVAVVAVRLILIGAAILLYCCLGGKKKKDKKSKDKANKPKVVASKVASKLSVAGGSKVSSKVAGGDSKMAGKQSSIAAGGKSKAASSTSAAGVSGSNMMLKK